MLYQGLPEDTRILQGLVLNRTIKLGGLAIEFNFEIEIPEEGSSTLYLVLKLYRRSLLHRIVSLKGKCFSSVLIKPRHNPYYVRLDFIYIYLTNRLIDQHIPHKVADKFAKHFMKELASFIQANNIQVSNNA